MRRAPLLRVVPGLVVWLALVMGAPPSAAATATFSRGAWHIGVAPNARRTWPVDVPHQVLARFDPPATRWGSGHRGVDLVAVEGNAVYAPAAGVVSFAGVVAGRPVLVVAHAGGLRSTFEPVQSGLPPGTVVRAGEQVGNLAAASGHCATSCLHWGVLRGQTYLDPLAWLRGRVVLLPLSVP